MSALSPPPPTHRLIYQHPLPPSPPHYNVHSQSLQASGPAAGSAASKGDPLYAELEHKKGKQSTVTPPDMTGVQYSEIKTDEVMI